jgi:hypothetical protein
MYLIFLSLPMRTKTASSLAVAQIPGLGQNQIGVGQDGAFVFFDLASHISG